MGEHLVPLVLVAAGRIVRRLAGDDGDGAVSVDLDAGILKANLLRGPQGAHEVSLAVSLIAVSAGRCHGPETGRSGPNVTD